MTIARSHLAAFERALAALAAAIWVGALAGCTEVDASSGPAPVAAGSIPLRPEEPVATVGAKAPLDLGLKPVERRAEPASAAVTPSTPPTPPRAVAPRAVDAVRIRVGRQRLELLAGHDVLRTYSVSTAKNGVGSNVGSQRTPLGRHRVCAKFGAGEPLGMTFEARQPTGKVATIFTAPIDLAEDVITSRVLWLEGLEAGLNRGPGVDSKARTIYIHGTNEEGLIGRPASHGCVRMRNADVVELFDLVPEGTLVEIVE